MLPLHGPNVVLPCQILHWSHLQKFNVNHSLKVTYKIFLQIIIFRKQPTKVDCKRYKEGNEFHLITINKAAAVIT